MKITSVSVLPILIPGKSAVWLKIGTHDYNLDHKDPQIAEQLRVYRKHRKIGFDELLESDVAVLASMKNVKPEDKPKELLAAVRRVALLTSEQSNSIKLSFRKNRLVISTNTPDVGEAVNYFVPRGKHVSVLEGDYVRAGEALMDGSADPHDILKIRGLKELAKYLVNEVQEVYRLQGVKINDKHIEVIVRQMVRQVSVTDPGDSTFLLGDSIEKWRFEEENQKIVEKGGKPALARPLLLGITKASLNTESFISAASFQETTKVLSDASIAGKVDFLKGLKENVIMGRLIPAGTGLKDYRNVEIGVRN